MMECDFCKRLIGVVGVDFVDGKTKIGPWANMCVTCHKARGVGLGLGLGQLYHTDAQGRRTKVRG